MNLRKILIKDQIKNNRYINMDKNCGGKRRGRRSKQRSDSLLEGISTDIGMKVKKVMFSLLFLISIVFYGNKWVGEKPEVNTTEEAKAIWIG